MTSAAFGADPTGAADSTAAIQAAISAAETAGAGVVFLPAGTYRVEVPPDATAALSISGSGVVLRGAGRDSTRIVNHTTDMRNRAIIRCAPTGDANWRAASGASTPITSDLPGPTSTLPVANPALFRVGEWVVVRNEITEAWIAEHREDEWSGYGENLGGLAYLRRVTAVDGPNGRISIDLPIRYALKVRDAARVAQVAPPLLEIGLESFSIANREVTEATGWGESSDDYDQPGTGAYQCHRSVAIELVGLADAWVRDVASFQPVGNASTAHLSSNGVALEFCRNVTVTNCSFARPQYGGGGGNGYMFRVQDSSDCLVEDSESTFSRHGFILIGMAASGNVFHRCADHQTARYTGPTGEVVASGFGSEHHARFSHSNLTDHCTADASAFLAVYRPFGNAPSHNLTGAHSVFWNTEGIGDPITTAGGPSVTIGDGSEVVASQQSRYGYVIGTRGTRTGVLTGAYYTAADSAAKTDPVDHVEGVGSGDTLAPSSLYSDQLLRRRGTADLIADAGTKQVLRPPTTDGVLEARISSAPADLLAMPATFEWLQIDGPAEATLDAATSARTSYRLPSFGVYRFQVTATLGSTSTSSAVEVESRGATAATQSADRFAIQDATVRNSSEVSPTPLGSQTFLQMKRANAADFQREILLEFEIGDLDLTALIDAEMVLTPRDPSDGYHARVSTLPPSSWSESAVTWPSRPAIRDALGDVAGSGLVPLRFGVADAIRAARADGESRLGLTLAIVAQTSSSEVPTFVSREAGSPLSPRIVLTLLAPPPTIPPATVVPEALELKVGKRVRLRQGVAKLRGVVKSDTRLRSLRIRGPRDKTKATIVRKGRAWKARLELQPGRNRLVLTAIDTDGTRTRVRVVVTAR